MCHWLDDQHEHGNNAAAALPSNLPMKESDVSLASDNTYIRRKNEKMLRFDYDYFDEEMKSYICWLIDCEC